MQAHTTFAILSLAFGLGMVHALDADHIMAVTGLGSTRMGRRQTVKFCLRWALGHGTALILIGSAVLLFGMAIPSQLSHIAESLVGVVLIIIGGLVMWDLFKHKAHLHFHQHGNLPTHAHWHTHTHHTLESHANDNHMHKHGAVMVGILHGTAGSAPLLAIIPLTQLKSVWLGIGYLFLFGAGVLLAMFLFGGLLGKTFHWLNQWGTQVIKSIRLLVATSSIGFGIYLLQAH
jgi:nickel/cobalt exporter